jgi:anti-sigma regulatory factor (Ser/Thr protein kinase)
METLERRLEESGIRKIAKLIGDDIVYFNGGRDEREKGITTIKKLIDDCSYAISNEHPSESVLYKLAGALKKHFNSDYCAIGKVDGRFVEDFVDSCDESKKSLLNSVKRVGLDDQNCCVCKGLKSDENISYFNENEIKESNNYKVYKEVLGEVKYTTIIPIRDRDDVNKGYVQFINSRKKIVFNNIKPFYDSLMKLILIIKLHDVTHFKNDYDFISKVQKKVNDVDTLLTDIMKYLSKEFNAGVVSYRIPLLVGIEKRPLFFLRDCFINEEVARYYSKEDYFRERLVKNAEQMGGYKKLVCKKTDPVIIDKAKDTDYYSRIKDEKLHFRGDTLIIPILRDYSEKDKCVFPKKSKGYFCDNESLCSFRFAKYFGVFKLRILTYPDTSITDYDEADEWLSEETKKRLANLAKHISILLNAIVDKYENKSLDIFQKELKGTSFTKIKEFDEQCSRIVKKAIHTSNCAIYRYKNDKLTFSASSDPINEDFDVIIERYGERSDNLMKMLFAEKRPIYFVRNELGICNSIMIVPMIRKDNSKSGIMFLMGKDDKLKSNLSKTFWEHDKKHIEFIVNVLTRIEESDSERLTFLAQLSHELLRPVTEMVYRNDYYISIAKINPEIYTKKMLINELQNNIDMCMVFKYIIDDVEYIYSLSKGDVQYYYEMVDFRSIILDAIRLSEEEAYKSKSLAIRTFISKMPESLNIDKSRMMQVVVNLLRNAIRYSDEHQEIFVRYEFNNKKNCHEISFEDFGIPVIMNDKDKIFELYYRSKNASAKVPNGSGMGLYIVKQIMLAHGGDCYVKNDYYPTIFTIQIPNKK